MAGNENVILLIETMKNSFTKTEKKICDFVLRETQRIVYMSLTEFSDELNVSEGSIVRFCQKLGYSGFHPFKIALAISLNKSPLAYKDFEISPKEVDKLKDYITARYVEVIKETSEFVSTRILQESAKAILSAKKILISGVGASGITAQDAYYKFMRIGLNCLLTSDVHLQAMMTSQLSNGDALLAFSQSGSTLEIVDIASLAKKEGVKVIAITGYARSPLAKSADYVLLTPTRETPFESGALRSKIAQIYVLELLFMAVYLNMKESARENIEKTANAVSKWIY